jgi:hypothetical protein
VLRGRGAVVSLSDGAPSSRVLVPSSGQFASLQPMEARTSDRRVSRVENGRGRRRAAGVPRREVGARRRGGVRGSPGGRERPRVYAASAALVPAAEGKETVIFETPDALALLRAASVASEMKLKARYVGARRRIPLRDEVVAVKPDLVLRVDYPRPSQARPEEEWLDVPVSKLRAFDRAPVESEVAARRGRRVLADDRRPRRRVRVPARVREAIARGLSKRTRSRR